MDWGLRLCFLLALPSAVALGILAKPLTVALFQYGKFSAFDAAMTQRALVAYSVGLMGLIVVKVLAPGFYSRQDIKTPVKIAIITLIMTQVMNLAFIGPLKHAGLSLSIGLAACLNAALLYWQLRKQKIFTPQPGWLAFLLRLIIAVLVMAAALLGVMHLMPEWSLGTMPFRLMRLLAVVIAGVVAYFATLLVLGFRVKEFVVARRKRLWVKNPASPQAKRGFYDALRSAARMRAFSSRRIARASAPVITASVTTPFQPASTYSLLPSTDPSDIPINTTVNSRALRAAAGLWLKPYTRF